MFIAGCQYGSVSLGFMPSLPWLMASNGKRKSPGLPPPCTALHCCAGFQLQIVVAGVSHSFKSFPADLQAWSERRENELHSVACFIARAFPGANRANSSTVVE